MYRGNGAKTAKISSNLIRFGGWSWSGIAKVVNKITAFLFVLQIVLANVGLAKAADIVCTLVDPYMGYDFTANGYAEPGPNHGSTSGGTSVIMYCLNATGAAPTVEFGGVAATVNLAQGPYHLVIGDVMKYTVTTGPHAAGLVNLYVNDNDGHTGTMVGAYTYENDTLTLTDPNGGEDWVVNSSHPILWSSTGDITNVKIDYTKNEADYTEIIASTPDDGSYDWTVPNDPSATVKVRISKVGALGVRDSSDANFTISSPALPAPTVTSISPDRGTNLGGAGVTITGTNFVDGATVKFGANSATGVTVVSATSITATTPASGSTSGSVVDIIVTNPDTQVATLVSGYTYVVGGGGPGGSCDVIAPTSKVRLMSSPQYNKIFTVTADVDKDTSNIYSVKLYYKRNNSALPGTYTLYPIDGVVQADGTYTWSFDTNNTGGDGTYYFYSIATDNAVCDNKPARNTESVPEYPDTSVEVDTTSPYVDLTIPANNMTNVSSIAVVKVYFSEAMLQSNQYYSYEVTPAPEGGYHEDWDASEPGMPSVMNIYPNVGWLAGQTYTVRIIDAQDKTSHHLVSSEEGSPNPWSFTIAPPAEPGQPNLSESTIAVDKITAGPFDRLFYTITVKNTGDVDAPHANITAYLPNYYRINEQGEFVREWEYWKVGTYAYDSSVTTDGFTYYPDERSVSCSWIMSCDNSKPISILDGWMQMSEVARLVWNDFNIKAGETRVITFSFWLGDGTHCGEKLQDGDQIINMLSINDGVDLNDNWMERPAVTTVRVMPNLNNSTKTVNKSYVELDPNLLNSDNQLTYTITIDNGGSGDAFGVSIDDPLPAGVIYVAGSADNGATYDSSNNAIFWSGSVLSHTQQIITFKVRLNNDLASDTVVKNQVTIKWNGYEWVREASTQVDVPPYMAMITSINRGDNSTPLSGNGSNVNLYEPIVVSFSQPMNPSSVDYVITSLDDTIDLAGFVDTWSNNNTVLTITHPTTPFYIGSIHTLSITGQDISGKDLVDNDIVPNPIDFLTVQPRIAFTNPSTPVSYLKSGTVSDQMRVKLIDSLNNHDYSIETDEGVDLLLLSGTTTGVFDTNAGGSFDGTIKSIHLSKGDKTGSFYYKDTITVDPTYTTLAVADNGQGWLDATLYLVITETLPEKDSILFSSEISDIPANTFSDPITLVFQDKNNKPKQQLAGTRLYFYTTSSSGYFYQEGQGGMKMPLPFFVPAGSLTAQSVNPQYVDLSKASDSLTVFYKDSTIGMPTISVGDSWPIVGAGNNLISASQSVNIVLNQELEKELEEKLKDIEPVEDKTGRVLSRIDIDPISVVTLKREDATFKAVAYDTEGNVIDNAKFFWFVINGGGQILEKGIEGDSATTTFTAGDKLGFYGQTVLVATMYNKTLRATVADVAVVDLSDYVAANGGKLPATGPNQLQMIFLSIAVLSGIALAWVESYEKQHFTNPVKK